MSDGPNAPLRALAAVCAAILAAEFLTMWAFKPHELTWDHLTGAVADSAALLAISAPLLYLAFVRPMSRYLAGRTRAEAALRAARDDLEARVRERTAELEAANDSLRHEIEERARVTEKAALQANLLDAVEQAVVATDREGRVLYWNRYAESVYGWGADHAGGRHLTEVTPFDVEGACVGDVFSRCSATGGWAGEVRVTRVDGAQFPAQLTCSVVRGPRGTPTGFVYAFVDLTDRKQTEEELRYSEDKYSTLVENSPTGIFIYRNDRVVFGNPKFLEIVGRPREHIGSIAPWEMIHPEDWPAVEEIGRRRLAGEPTPAEYEYRVVQPSGAVRWVSARNTLVRFRGGVSVLGNIQDVTDRKTAETALRNSKEALRRLSARLLTAQEEERQRVARDLHDSIGQSLSAIKFVVERALEGPWPDLSVQPRLALQSLVPTIQGSVEEVRRISMALRPSTLDDLGLVATIAWFCREVTNQYPHLRLERTVEVAEGDVPEALKTVIFRILQEALNNVAKHSGAAEVAVALRREGGELALVVRDDGRGFQPDEVRRGEGPGGFGLPFMRERAELSGGSFWVESAPGEGTAVTARWPLQG